MKRKERFLQSKFLKSTILGAAGLIAITLGGVIVYVAGVILNLDYLSTPFTDELYMLIKFPLFFIIAALIKIVIGGKIIEWLVKYISKLLGIKKIIIAPDKPITFLIVKKRNQSNSKFTLYRRIRKHTRVRPLGKRKKDAQGKT